MVTGGHINSMVTGGHIDVHNADFIPMATGERVDSIVHSIEKVAEQSTIPTVTVHPMAAGGHINIHNADFVPMAVGGRVDPIVHAIEKVTGIGAVPTVKVHPVATGPTGAAVSAPKAVIKAFDQATAPIIV